MGAQPAKAFQLSTVESLESVVSRALGGSRRVAESKSRRAIISQSRYARIGGSKRSCHRTMSRGGKSSIYWTMEEVLRAWRLPPEPLHLKMDEVHVWGVQLTHLSTEIREFYDQLAPDERRRAESFHFERDRANFIAARGVLRDILGRYLLCRPDQICFDYGPQGKPALRVSTGAPPLEFNVSHSHELALYAVTRGREVGLDIEYVREDLASEEIAQRFFSAREVAALRALPRAAWTRAFFNCWARKEAYIKATGKGLTQSLSGFSVSLDPETPPALTWVEGDLGEAERWSMREIIVDPCYTAAVAAGGSNWTLQRWRWRCRE